MPTKITIRSDRRHNPDAIRPKLPPAAVQLASLAQAAAGTVTRAIKGQPVLRSAEQQEACLAVCHGCEHWLPKAQRCSKCGCFGAFKKWIAASKCPLAKWPG